MIEPSPRQHYDPSDIAIEFVSRGSTIDPAETSGRIALDVGNALCPGVLDHHHLVSYLGSTAALVLRHPEFLAVCRGSPPSSNGPRVMLVTHVEPDLDAVCSVYLATCWLTQGCFPPAAAALARYVDRVDMGCLGMSQQRPFALYSAYSVLLWRLASRKWRDDADKWTACIHQGAEIVEFVVTEANKRGVSILDVDAFDAPGQFGPGDRQRVTDDLVAYRAKLADPRTAARSVRLSLPDPFGGRQTVDSLCVRDVQSPTDPTAVMFFKDWARSDRLRAPADQGYVALSIFQSATSESHRRCWLSVRPDSGVTLSGLGALLDQAESEARTREYGVDDRQMDPITRSPLAVRPGYLNSDPWYDGRAHGDTIVDAPRSGTRLTADEIEQLLLQFGQSESEASPPVEASLDGMAADSSSLEASTNDPRSDSQLNLWSRTATAWRERHGPTVVKSPPAVFISYTRSMEAWVRENVFEPLASRLGPDSVFFDRHTLRGGANWFESLAAHVAACRVFLPIYCEEYFQKTFCKWELQTALVRDPIGASRIVVPFATEAVVPPAYCALIQFELPNAGQFSQRMLAVVEEILQGQPG